MDLGEEGLHCLRGYHDDGLRQRILGWCDLGDTLLNPPVAGRPIFFDSVVVIHTVCMVRLGCEPQSSGRM